MRMKIEKTIITSYFLNDKQNDTKFIISINKFLFAKWIYV